MVGNYAKQRFAHCRGAHYGDLVYGNKNGQSNGASGIGADQANADELLPVVNCTVWGNQTHADYDLNPKKKREGCWPWVSYSSVV